MGAVSEQARTESVRIKLSPNISQKLEELAVEYGMPTSTLGAFAISQWIIEQENRKKTTKLIAMDASRRMAEAFNEKAIEKVLTATLPGVVKAMAELGHTVDCEAAVAAE